MVVCAHALLLLSIAASAQPLQTLSGVVRDTTGAVLPGVTVTVAGPALAAPRVTVTDGEGRFALDTLPAGRYRVTAALNEFEPRTTEIDVHDQPVSLDLVLALSSFSERVTVTATKTGVADIQATPIAITALPARTIDLL